MAHRSPTHSRRSVLAAAGALASLGPVRGGPDGPTVTLPRELTVYTQNLGLGTRLARLIDPESRTVKPERVYRRYLDVRESGVGSRMAAVAGVLARERPALVGLQEAALVRRGPADGGLARAEKLVFDFLGSLRSALERTDGPSYRPVAVSENADEAFLADPGDGGEPFDLRLTDRDVVLAREDVVPDSADTGTFAINARLTLADGRTVVAERGYCLVEARVGGSPVTFANTHLASTVDDVRRAQAAELVGRLGPAARPLVLVGDVNSAPTDPEPSAYAELTETFGDVWRALDAGEGPTCCQFSNLTNLESRLRRRVDVVFHDGPVRPRAVRRTFHDPESRVPAFADGEEVLRWPSDHAGVLADVVVEPDVGLYDALTGLL